MGAAAVTPPQLTGLAALGLLVGLILFGRGLVAYRRGSLVSSIGTSRITSLAAGEVRVSGTVKPAALTLVSPLQSRPCVYYRARIVEDVGREQRTVLSRERGVDFLVADGTGEIHVFPRGAHFDLAERFHERDGVMGDTPPGLAINDGPDTSMAAVDHEAAVAALLTVHPGAEPSDPLARMIESSRAGAMAELGSSPSIGLATGRRAYDEARLEPGDVVTVVGTALPFADLPDPANADLVEGPLGALADPEISADLETARASGGLVGDPGTAWGNAAIEGFGIGQPVRPPSLDPAARPEPVAPAPVAAARRAVIQARFEIAPDALVLAAAPDAPLSILAGAPGEAEDRARGAFLLGLGGAVLAIVCALILALSLSPAH